MTNYFSGCHPTPRVQQLLWSSLGKGKPLRMGYPKVKGEEQDQYARAKQRSE